MKCSDVNKRRQEQLLKEHNLYRVKVAQLLKSTKERSSVAVDQPNIVTSAHQSEHMCIKFAPEKGRHTVASGRIEAGEVVLVEEAFAAILNEEYRLSHCSHCFRVTATLIPCCTCCEGYCSPECRVKAWQHYHWLECPISHVWKQVDWILQLCLRILLSAAPEELLACIKRGVVKEHVFADKYRLVYSLAAHNGKFSNSTQKVTLEKMADVLNDCFGSSVLSYLQNFASAQLNSLQSSENVEAVGGGSGGSEEKIHGDHEVRGSGDGEGGRGEGKGQAGRGRGGGEDGGGGGRGEGGGGGGGRGEGGGGGGERGEKAGEGRGQGGAAAEGCVDGDSGEEERRAEVISMSQLKELFFHHLLQIRCNTHVVSTVTNNSTPSVHAPLSSEPDTTEGRVIHSMEAKLGNAIYPTASLINHSCNPNVLFRFNGCLVSVIATREIQRGEEINNCYGPMVGRMKTEERREWLRRKYFFECHCPACENPSCELRYRNTVARAFACLRCKGPLMEDDRCYQCLDCGESLSSSQLEESKKTMEKARHLYEMACNDKTEAKISLLLKCWKLQSRVLHVHHLELGQTSDVIAQAYAVQGDFRTAAHYCQLSSEAVSAALGRSSIELGHELHKLSQLFFNGYQYLQALESAKKALRILTIYQGSNHPDCLELVDTIKLLAST